MRLFYLKHGKAIQGFVWIVVIYIIFIGCFYYFFCKNAEKTTGALDTAFGEGYGQSLSSSMLEDIIFFGAIGFVVTVISFLISVASPEDNDFEIRIRSLANSKKIDLDSDLYAYLKSKALSFLAFNETVVINIEVKDYLEQQNNQHQTEKVFLIFTDVVFKITNMCRDVAYLDNKATSFITGDVMVNGSYGNLILLGELEKPIIQMKKLIKKEFRHEFPLKIEKNSEVSWGFKHELWSLVLGETDDNRWGFFESTRYSKHIYFNIKNSLNSGKTLKFDLETTSGKSPTPNILASGKELASDTNYWEKFSFSNSFYPGDKIRFYIHEP